MKVLRLYGTGDMRMQDEPTPLPGGGEALVHIRAVGICGSDLHWFSQAGIGDTSLQAPLILGHEAAGLTVAGERVAIDPAIPCDQCGTCRQGNPHLCPDVRFAGHGDQDGALREMLAWPSRCLVPLPASLDAAAGAMLEPLGVAMHAVDLGKVRPGMRVGVFGCGPIGLLVLQLCRLAGAAQVLFTEPLAHRRQSAEHFGGRPWRQGLEVDVAFECAGANAAVVDAIESAKPAGHVVLVGIPDDDQTSFPASVARRKGLTIRLSRRMKGTYPRAVQLVENGQVDVLSLVTHRFGWDEAAQAFAVAQRREGLKVILGPG
jgi:L-iditol 2-dehydrogenase